MIIEKVDLFKVPPRWLFVKITTKSGYVGWGEPVLEAKTDSVAAVIRDIEEYILGKDAAQIEDLFISLTRGGFYRPGPVLMSAISGIEQALWDIKGKKLNVPVYDLLGGKVRNKVLMYGWVGGDNAEDALTNARDRIDKGYKAIKSNLTGKSEWILNRNDLNGILEYFRELRAQVGDEVGIAIDFHGRIHRNMVKIIVKELEEIQPLFYEEPLLPEYSPLLKGVSDSTSIPIASGERLIGRREFRELIENTAVSIIQPDLCHVGGIWEARKISAFAEMYDIAVAPHCPLGPIALASSLQLNACTPNAIILESSSGIHYNEGIDLTDYLINKEDFKIDNGYINLSSKPGLGVEIDERVVTEMTKKGHNWRNPIWRGEDGSFLEW